jgi:hypothetical protein
MRFYKYPYVNTAEVVYGSKITGLSVIVVAGLITGVDQSGGGPCGGGLQRQLCRHPCIGGGARGHPAGNVLTPIFIPLLNAS